MNIDIEREPTLRQTLDAIDLGVVIFSSDRTLLYINPAMKAITGDRNAVGKSLDDLIQPHRLRTDEFDEVPQGQFPIEKAFAGQDTEGQTFVYIPPNGRHRWLSVSCRRIVNASDELEQVVTTVRDITDRKSREDKLRFMIESSKILSLTSDFRKRLDEKARLAVPALADWCAIDIVRDDGSLERVVTVHRDPELLAYAEDLPKKLPSDPNAPTGVYRVIKTGEPQFIPLLTQEMIDAGLTQLPPERASVAREALDRLNLKSLMTLPISARGTVLGVMTIAFAESGRTYSDDDFQFFQEFCNHLGVLLDNWRLYEEVQKRDRSKDLFLASLSHELRNPLAPIKSALELLKMREMPTDVREEVDVIEHQFDHLAKLLNDLLDVSRFTQSKIEIAPRSVELRKLVERALKSTDALLRTADITLHYTYPSSPINVWADDTRVEQAISNLMNNATKFTPSGGSIWVELEKEGNDAVIRIRDNGEGIDAEDLSNIFDMYYQGRDRGHTSGLGIGLLLVRKIIEMHGGSIEAKSEGRGHGSEFTIRMPMSNVLSLEGEQEYRKKSIDRRILVVDDNQQA
ncbi:MAG: ATP-binding protein, partial [Candidatus Paceibacterota bacterium]